jgi:hypothetical protein
MVCKNADAITQSAADPGGSRQAVDWME